VKNYALKIARLQLEEAALKYGTMCARQKAYDSSLETALHHFARAFYEASKSDEEKIP
jgi:hypothetical protein